jgi:hypothetical protein
MNYRSPILSLERELETLEAELAALRALPPAQPRPAPAPSKKARASTERETRLLRAKLKKLETRLEARSVALGVRELTPREIAAGRAMRRVALALVAAGGLVLSVHLGLASLTRLVWTETSCTVEMDDDVYVASYTRDAHTHRFVVDGKSRPEHTRCWVPGPSVLENVGTVEVPTRPAVPLAKKLSFVWIFTALCVALLGLTFHVASYLDERKRRNREIEADVFESAD